MALETAFSCKSVLNKKKTATSAGHSKKMLQLSNNTAEHLCAV